MWDALDHITFYVFFSRPSRENPDAGGWNFASVPARDLVLVSFSSVTIMSGALVAADPPPKRPVSGPVFTSFFQGAVRFQSTITVAISGALFGERGLTLSALSVASIIPTVQLYTVLVLLIFGRGNGEISFWPILRRLSTNPFTLACVLGLALNFTGAPDALDDTSSILGAPAIALTMLAVGAGVDWRSVHAAQNLVAAKMAPLLIAGRVFASRLRGLTSGWASTAPPLSQ